MTNDSLAYEWFRKLIDDEISEELGTINNERAWSMGSDDVSTSDMHENNIKEHEKYIEILKEAYKGVMGEEYDSKTVNAR